VKIPREFFQRDPLSCARELIGCEFVWKGTGGVIVETEAYSVRNDEACHTFSRPSSRGKNELKNLCSGPGKLTRALGMDGDFHGRDIFESPGLKLILPSDQPEILEGPRIGISRSAQLPWRFTKAGSQFLSAPMKAS